MFTLQFCQEILLIDIHFLGLTTKILCYNLDFSWLPAKQIHRGACTDISKFNISKYKNDKHLIGWGILLKIPQTYELPKHHHMLGIKKMKCTIFPRNYFFKFSLLDESMCFRMYVMVCLVQHHLICLVRRRRRSSTHTEVMTGVRDATHSQSHLYNNTTSSLNFIDATDLGPLGHPCTSFSLTSWKWMNKQAKQPINHDF